MSITFSADDSPRGEDLVYDCHCSEGGEFQGVAGCSECDGTGEVRFKTYLFSVNYSNVNAWHYTEYLTEDGEGSYCGYIHRENVPTVLRRLETAKRHIQFMGGTKDDRLAMLIRMFQWAEANNKGVSWG